MSFHSSVPNLKFILIWQCLIRMRREKKVVDYEHMIKIKYQHDHMLNEFKWYEVFPQLCSFTCPSLSLLERKVCLTWGKWMRFLLMIRSKLSLDSLSHFWRLKPYSLSFSYGHKSHYLPATVVMCWFIHYTLQPSFLSIFVMIQKKKKHIEINWLPKSNPSLLSPLSSSNVGDVWKYDPALAIAM